MSNRRVFVTGYGLSCGNGNNAEEFWENCRAGKSGLKFQPQWEHLDCRIAGIVDTSNYTPQELREVEYYRGRRMVFSRHAMKEALASANLNPKDLEELAIYLGIDFYAGDEYMIDTFINLYPQGKGEDRWEDFNLGYTVQQGMKRMFNKANVNQELMKSQMFYIYQNFMTDYLRSLAGVPGMSRTINNLCVSSGQAIGEAFHAIRYGDHDVVMTGGLEEFSFISAFTFSKLGVYVRADSADKSCLPFDARRKGTVLGEGCGLVILESEEHMEKRGAKPIAEVLGYGTTNNVYHVTNSPSDGKGLAASMQIALDDAKMESKEIDVVLAHGTGTYINDLSESAAINLTFDHKPLAHSMKSYVGHTLSAAGVLNFITGLLEIKNQYVLPTLFLKTPGKKCEINHVPEGGVEQKVEKLISNAAGFGGFNASVVFGKVS